jgi:hypothetical protein
MMLNNPMEVEMNAQSCVRVDDGGYRFNHGAKPRGRGTWAFGPKRNTDAMSPDMFWSSFVTYAEAKRHAVAHFAAKGVYTVYVQS